MADPAVLIVYRKQLGDLLLLQPAIEHLQASTGMPVRVRTRPGFADLLGLMPGSVSLAEPLRGTPSHRVYCFDTKASSLSDALGAWPARRVLVEGRNEGWRRLLFHERVSADGRQEYRALRHFRALGGENFHAPRLNPPPQHWMPDGLPKRYLLVHPTSAWRRKTWPVAAWSALLEALLPRYELPLVLTAGSEPWEQEMAGAIATRLPGTVINLAGKTSLQAYLATLAKADAVLTVDGSASHLAAAFGKPVLTLFGPTNPVHWHWPTPATPRLWAADFSNEPKPDTGAIPVEAVKAVAFPWLEAHLHD